MRKIKPVELVALAALMSVGSFAHADDYEELPITNLGSVVVTGTYYEPPSAVWFNYGPPAGGYGGSVTLPAYPTTAEKDKIIRCANKYGTFKKPAAYTIDYSNKFGWISTVQPGVTQYTNTNTAPSSTWSSIAGLTSVSSAARYIWIFAPGWSTFQEHLITMEHEFAHANGVVDETVAETAGQAAYSAFVADGGLIDNGAKCN